MSPVTFLRISSSLASLSSFFVSLLSLSVPFFLFATRVDERHGWKDRTERLWRNAGRAYSHYPQPVDFWQMEDGQRPHCSTCSRHVLVRGCESEFRLTAPTVNAWCALSLYPKQTGVNISIPRTKAFYYSSSAQFFSIVRFFSFHSIHTRKICYRERDLFRSLHGIRLKIWISQEEEKKGGPTRYYYYYYYGHSAVPRITFKLPTIYHEWSGQRSVFCADIATRSGGYPYKIRPSH